MDQRTYYREDLLRAAVAIDSIGSVLPKDLRQASAMLHDMAAGMSSDDVVICQTIGSDIVTTLARGE